jgi:hypothetical protein
MATQEVAPAGNAPVEAKVKAGTLATLVSTAVMGWLLVQFPGIPDALTEPVSGMLAGLVTSCIAAGVMWLTKHTPRVNPALARDGMALAKSAYETYGDAMGWSMNGHHMPAWDVLTGTVKDAWVAAAGEVHDRASH